VRMRSSLATQRGSPELRGAQIYQSLLGSDDGDDWQKLQSVTRTNHIVVTGSPIGVFCSVVAPG